MAKKTQKPGIVRGINVPLTPEHIAWLIEKLDHQKEYWERCDNKYARADLKMWKVIREHLKYRLQTRITEFLENPEPIRVPTKAEIDRVFARFQEGRKNEKT